MTVGFKMESSGESSEFSEIMLECTDCRNVRFVGKKLGEAEGRDFIWMNKSLYITLAGKYVAYMEWIPIHPFQKTSRAKVCKNQEEIFEFFGDDHVSKDLYKKAGIEDTIDVA